MRKRTIALILACTLAITPLLACTFSVGADPNAQNGIRYTAPASQSQPAPVQAEPAPLIPIE